MWLSGPRTCCSIQRVTSNHLEGPQERWVVLGEGFDTAVTASWPYQTWDFALLLANPSPAPHAFVEGKSLLPAPPWAGAAPLLLCFSLHSERQECYTIQRCCVFGVFLDRPEWLATKPDHYSSSIIRASLLTNFPPGFFRYWQSATVTALKPADSSLVTAWGSLILLPPREPSYVVHMCLWNLDVVFFVSSLYISKNCDWLSVISLFLQTCSGAHIPSQCSLLGYATAVLFFSFW